MRSIKNVKVWAAPAVLAAVIPLAGCEMPAEHEMQKPALDEGGEELGPSGHAIGEHATPDHQAMVDDVQLPNYGVVQLAAMGDSGVTGTLELRGEGKGFRVSGKVTGLTPGKHGFHIHEFGDLRSDDGKSAGGHFNPEGHEHGGPDAEQRHVGDLGNIEADENGEANVDVRVDEAPLHFVLGRAMVVHAGEDDLKSQPSGDAGARVAVGVIGVGNGSM